MAEKTLYRSTKQQLIGGVCGGIAEYFDVDPTLVRIAAAFGFFLGWGSLGIAYIIMWAVVPEAPSEGVTSGSEAGGQDIAPPSNESAQSGEVTGSTFADTPEAGQTQTTPPPAGDAKPSYGGYAYEGYTYEPNTGMKKGILMLGLILVLVGMASLAPMLGLDFDWWRLWPLFILVPGVVQLITPERTTGTYSLSRAGDALWTIILGLALLACSFEWVSWVMWLYFIQMWPLLVIAGGIAIIGAAVRMPLVGAAAGLILMLALVFSALIAWQGPFALPFSLINPFPAWPQAEFYFDTFMRSLDGSNGVM